MEMREVIETFSTKDFLGISAARDSDEQCVQNQIETREHDQLLQSILNLKEKNLLVRSQHLQRIRQPGKQTQQEEGRGNAQNDNQVSKE